MIPAHYKKLYTAQQIREGISQIAPAVSEWAALSQKGTGEQVLCVCVLRGGVHFFTDLLRGLSVSVEPGFCRTWTYTSLANAEKREGIRVQADEVHPRGKFVLLVDDICDTGVTLKHLETEFKELGALDVKTAVLIHRTVANSVFTPTWSCFKYAGPEWFVGYGMEDKNTNTNLPDVYTIAPSV